MIQAAEEEAGWPVCGRQKRANRASGQFSVPQREGDLQKWHVQQMCRKETGTTEASGAPGADSRAPGDGCLSPSHSPRPRGKMLSSPGNLLGWGYLHFPRRDS